MKFLVLVLFVVSMGAEAGSLINRRTGEYLDFDYNSETHEVRIQSNSPHVASKVVQLSNIRSGVGPSKFLFLSRSLANLRFPSSETGQWRRRGGRHSIRKGLLILIPPATTAVVGAFALDIIAFPFQAIARLAQNIPARRAYRKTIKAILTDSEVKISNRIFMKAAHQLSKLD